MYVNLTEIDDNVLSNYKSIEAIDLPSSITKIGDNFLYRSKVKTIDLRNCDKLYPNNVPKEFLYHCECDNIEVRENLENFKKNRQIFRSKKLFSDCFFE